MENSNSRADLERIKNDVLQQLQTLPPVPSVAVAVMPPATKVCLWRGMRALRVCLRRPWLHHTSADAHSLPDQSAACTD
jgi:hypothetical protein